MVRVVGRETRRHKAFRIHEGATTQSECGEDHRTNRRRAESRNVPTETAGDAGHEEGRRRPPAVARDTVDRKRVSQSRLSHALIEECEIGGMEDAVADTGKGR